MQQEDAGVGSDHFAVEFSSNFSPTVRMKTAAKFRYHRYILSSQDFPMMSFESFLTTLLKSIPKVLFVCAVRNAGKANSNSSATRPLVC